MYEKSTLTVQQLTSAVTESVVGYKDSAKAAAETVRPAIAASLLCLIAHCCAIRACLWCICAVSTQSTCRCSHCLARSAMPPRALLRASMDIAQLVFTTCLEHCQQYAP